MNELNKQKTFDLRCRSKRGEKLALKDYKFLQKMQQKYPIEYSAMNIDIFNATKPFGAI